MLTQRMDLWHRNAGTRPMGRGDGRGEEGEQRLSCGLSTHSWPRAGSRFETLRPCRFALSLVSWTGRMGSPHTPADVARSACARLTVHCPLGTAQLDGRCMPGGPFRMCSWAQRMQAAAVIVTTHPTVTKRSHLASTASRLPSVHTPSLTLERRPSPGSTQGAHIPRGAWARHCCPAPRRTTHRDRGGREKGPRMHKAGRPAESLARILDSLSEKVYLLRTYCVQGTDSGARRSASDEQMWSLP